MSSLLNINLAASSVSETYLTANDRTPTNSLTKLTGAVTDHLDADIASLKAANFIRTQITERRKAAAKAADTISTIQVFEKEISSVDSVLNQMAVLAEDISLSTQSYTEEEIAAKQKQFNNLAAKVNGIVNNAKSGTNKFLSADGTDLSVTDTKGMTVNIAHRDLSLDIKKLDLSIISGSAGSIVVDSAAEQNKNYKAYLQDKIERLKEISSVDVAAAVSSSEAVEIVNGIIANSELLVKIQAKVPSANALKLLK
ncbi:hypothetical protein ACFL3G_03070 [Planctomycetota bacterium]